jgi:hypothetical protein
VNEAIQRWPTWAKVALPLAVVIIVVGLFVAPGPDPAKKNSSTTTTAAVKGPGGAYAVCAQGIGLKVVRRNATHLQTSSGQGKVVANTTVFASPTQAKAFDAPLEGADHAQAGRTVTVVNKSITGATEASAILGCARKG